MKKLTDEEISNYIDLDSPLNSCASYKFEANGYKLFSEVIGSLEEINGLPFRIYDNIPRCTATNLRPKTDKSTFNLPQKLKQIYGHSDLGVYILPLQDGEISCGDQIKF